MPEFYVEPMKDRQSCFVCKKTVTGKKWLLTCIKCHAITYCGVECQGADWPRHEWNCVPVMVTEVPGKGRGLVAGRDIEKGDLIFKDDPVIKLAINDKGLPVDPEFMTSLKQQIESLPAEAKSQYYKLSNRADANTWSRNDNAVLKLFLSPSKVYQVYHEGKENDEYSLLHLNLALVNHSCAPNATNSGIPRKQEGVEDLRNELRAIKNISKGEEITICYFMDVKKFGSIPRKMKTDIAISLGFNCECPVCLGQVPGQEKTLKKLIEVHNKLKHNPSDWKRESGLWSRIVDLIMELYIGHTFEKISALESLAGFAHLARDKALVRKAMDMLKQFAEELKIEAIQRSFEVRERNLAQWSKEFSSNNAPERREIEFFMNPDI